VPASDPQPEPLPEPDGPPDPERGAWALGAAVEGVGAPGGRRAGLAVALAPFTYRRFALLWSGGLVSTVGSWMQTVAVGALVVSRTGNATWAVLVAAGTFLPIGLLSPLGGSLADRLPRRAVLVSGNLADAAVAAVLALLVAHGDDGPGALVLLVTIQGAVSALVNPFQAAILPDLVPRSSFLAAASLNAAQFNLGRVIGPAVAGVAIAAFGYPVAFAANAVSFLAVVVALAFVPLPRPSGRPESLRASLRAGLGAARRQTSCWAAISTIAVVALLASPFIALVPVMARHVDPGSARTVGRATAVLTTAQGLGAVVGALSLAPLAAAFGRGRTLLVALGVLPVTLVLYALSTSLVAAAASLALVGLVYLGTLSGLSTVVQLHAPAAFRGRILSIYLVALGVAYPLGSLLQGPLVDRVGIAWTTAGSAAVLALVMVVVGLRRPAVAVALARPQALPAAGSPG